MAGFLGEMERNMSEMWEKNEQIDEEHELVVTDHRDADLEDGASEDERSVETVVTDGAEVLEEFGEDVSSSSAERGSADGL